MKAYLKEQEKFFGCKLAYFGNVKKRFQIDVPDRFSKKADNTLESSKNGKDPTKRYNTEEIEEIESEDPFLGTSCGNFLRYFPRITCDW